jgi:glycosyltransferase involved in cell wall biosynthesis
MLSDGALRARLGSNGPAWARNFTWEKIAEQQEAYYRAVAGGFSLSADGK